MTKVHLSSLAIRQFRTFQELQIPRLGQVNLLTGKNGIGKSAVLEALRLYADFGSLRMVRQLLTERDELYRLQNQREELQDSTTESDLVESVRNLYFGRPALTTQPVQIEIGPMGDPSANLSIAAVSLVEEIGVDRVRRYRRALQHYFFDGEGTGKSEHAFVEQIPGLAIQAGVAPELIVPLNRLTDRAVLSDSRSAPPRYPLTYVPTQGLSAREIRVLWEQITLTDLEAQVQAALNAVAPAPIEGLNVIGSASGRIGWTVIVKTAGIHQPLPLRSMGEGLVRSFGLALALVNTKGGLLLIDEIDSGLHHSVQYEIWKLIFQVAQRLDIQVFATTHSWDAVESFQQAAAENVEVEGMLIRLERRGDEIIPTLFDEDKLAIVTRAQIEVR